MSPWFQRRRPERSIDPMLQSERTAMAWQRTALGVGGIGAALLHSGILVTVVIGAVGLVSALTLLVVTERRYEHIVERVQGGRPPSSPALMRIMSATVVLLAVGALTVVVVPAR